MARIKSDTTATRTKPSKGQLIAGTVIAVFAIGGLVSCFGGGSDSAAPTTAPAPVVATSEAPAAAPVAPVAPVQEAPAAPVEEAPAAAPVAPAPAPAADSLSAQLACSADAMDLAETDPTASMRKSAECAALGGNEEMAAQLNCSADAMELAESDPAASLRKSSECAAMSGL